MSARASAGLRYFTIVASRAASVILSIRSARFSGFFRIRSRYSLFPRMIPAWGPPSSLSPLKVTTSAPAARQSRTVGSRSRPYRSRSIRQPLPRSSTTGRRCFFPSATSEARSASSVNPMIRKLLVWTLRMIPVSGTMARS